MRISDWSSDVCSSDLDILLVLQKVCGAPSSKGAAAVLSEWLRRDRVGALGRRGRRSPRTTGPLHPPKGLGTVACPRPVPRRLFLPAAARRAAEAATAATHWQPRPPQPEERRVGQKGI